MAPKTKGKQRRSGNGQKKETVSRSLKAGTLYPVGRLHSMLKRGRYADRIGGSAGVMMAAVLEYLTAEIMELSGNLMEE